MGAIPRLSSFEFSHLQNVLTKSNRSRHGHQLRAQSKAADYGRAESSQSGER
jgi:hypothetical protein